MKVDVKQGSDKWLSWRAGLVTGSNQAKVMANYGKAFGNPAQVYATQKAIERITGRPIGSTYKNAYMQRGNDLEPDAIALYERTEFIKVEDGGFFVKGNLGDSPDGLIGHNGCIEVKTVLPHIHEERLRKGGIDLKHKWQIVSHLYVCERDYCDFVSYCPEMPKGAELYVYRVYPDEEMLDMFLKRNAEFEELIQEKIEIIKKRMK